MMQEFCRYKHFFAYTDHNDQNESNIIHGLMVIEKQC